MIQDPEAFMDPTGGAGRNNPLMDSIWGVGAAFALESGLIQKHLINPLEKYRAKELVSQYQSRAQRSALNVRFSKFSNPNLGNSEGFGRLSRVERRKAGIKDISRYRAEYQTKYAKHNRTFKSLRRNIRGLGLMTLAAGLADVGLAIGRPGVKQSVQEADQRALDVGMLDIGLAYTQRQRAIMAIHDSQMSIRHTIGHEAMHFHR